MSCQCGPQIYTHSPTGGVTLAGAAVEAHRSDRMNGGIVCGGSATVSTNQVWDGFAQVFHLVEEADGTEGEYLDSCGGDGGTGGEAPRTPARTVGLLTYAQEFDSTDYITIPMDDMGQDSDFTVSLWGKADNQFLSRVFFSRGRTHVSDGDGWSVEIGHDEARRPYVTVQTVDADGEWHKRTARASAALSRGCWYHLAATWDSGSSLKLYVDADLLATTAVAETRLAPSAGSGSVGRRDGVKYLEGAACELRVSPVVRPADWLEMEFNNLCRLSQCYTYTVSTPTVG